MSLAFKALLESLETHPKDWYLSDYSLCNLHNKVRVWVIDGFLGYRITCPAPLSFCLREKYVFGRAFKKWRDSMVAAAFTQSEEEDCEQ